MAERQDAVFVANGKIEAAIQSGRAWKEGDGYVSNRGRGNYLYAAKGLGKGDFTIRVRLAIERIEQTAASLVINDRSNFGFDSRGRKLFVQGPFFGGPTKLLGPAADHIQPGKPFDFEVIRQGDSVRCLIDGNEVHRFSDQGTVLDLFGLRPWRATMRVYEFRAIGQLIETAGRRPAEGLHDADRRHLE